MAKNSKIANDPNDANEAKAQEGELKKSRTVSQLATGANIKDELNNNKIRVCAVVGLAVYASIGALWFSLVEGHSALDAYYYIFVTLTTVGYGDFYPETPAGQLFACFYILIGLTFIGWLLGVLADAVFAQVNEAAEKADAGLKEDNTWIEKINKSAYKDTYLSCMIAGMFIMLGWIVFGATHKEDMTWIGALYYSVVTCTTVGYGDLLPKTDGDKVFVMFWALGGTIATGRAIGSFMGNFCEVREAKRQKEELKKKITKDEVKELDEDGDGKVSIAEFALYKIEKMGLVSPEQINEIAQEFKKMDKDGDMMLDIASRRNSMKSATGAPGAGGSIESV